MSKNLMVALVGVDEAVRPVIEQLVESLGFEAVHFRSAGEFIVSPQRREARCLIVDAHLSGMGGLQLQTHLASSGRHIPLIFITTSKDKKTREEALRSGALDILRKPEGERALLRELRSALKLGGGDTGQ